MDGDFELNKIGYYTPAIVEENSWLNDKQKPEDLAKYGKNYGVVFAGDAQTYLWTAKNAPEVGKKYWGHLQATSGKSIRFKTDKQEDAPVNGSSPQSQPKGSYVAHNEDKEDSIARAVALKAAVEFGVANKYDDSTTLELADVFLAWLKGNENTSRTSSSSTEDDTPNPGYQKFQEARNKVKQDPEIQSLIEFGEQYNGDGNDYPD